MLIDFPSMYRSVGQHPTDIGIYRGPTSATLSYLATRPPRGLEGHFLPLSYTMTATTALEEALNDAISSGRFIDTKIVLFSRRDSTGRICKPKALYANSHALESVSYFKDCEFSHVLLRRAITLPPSTIWNICRGKGQGLFGDRW